MSLKQKFTRAYAILHKPTIEKARFFKDPACVNQKKLREKNTKA